ncbi:Disease resistance protein RGA2 [Rhynchospora pubera]|uniref:Disease resistance protein RGA2 n=1 Tax=Rhynchospora pubera TaxID=906938 RepID=A0AAV8EUD7_9POAL|nr:Disease resistance protein RGA2 [Rhynchospora pubera]
MALVAETVSTSIISQLVETVLSYANGSWWPSANAVKAEAERLQAVLPQVKTVLCAAQRGKINHREPELEAWMWQFRDAVEEAGDVLDKIEYYKLEEKVRARDNKVSGPFSGCKRKLANFVRNAFVNDGVLKKLREAVKGLEAVSAGVGPFLELVKGLNEEVAVYNFRQTGPLLADMVVGRGKEKEMVVEWLTANLNSNLQEQLSAFVIFGAGGMGKTTLAQLVCNDPKVKEKFEQIVWVCVSDNDNVVDAATVIKMIIEDFRKKKCDLSNLSTLQTTLQEIVATKKFLLVLDDVWRDETRAEWEKIVAPLKFGQLGSKILLTTRMESVAHMIAGLMDGKRQNLRLEGLNEKDFITLLFRHAFAGTSPDEYQHLHKIGNQIARRLWACPLAAKVIGGVLNNSLNFDYWNKIFEEDIPDVKTSKDGIMGILKLSYYHLPSNLQSCFRYCSIFPQDMILEEKYLVEKWMGSGLILESGHGKRPEDIAHEYLGQLTAKSFLSKEKERYDAPNDNVYRIHDLLHELARSLSKGECLRMTEHAINIPPTTRHLSIKARNIGNLREICYLSKLYTLEITCIEHDLDDNLGLNEILTGMKSLRSLSVYSRAVKKLPNCIGDLLHLRAISFGGQRASKQNLCQIPESFYQLYHLMLFSLRDEIDIQECGLEGMGNLINLRYLEFSCYQDTPIPWVGNLHSLQELNDFCVRREKGYSIAELKHLTELHKLCVHDLHNISNPDEALEANINQKYHLQALSLNWSKGNRDRDELVANNLRPPVNLNELEISGYSAITSPNWMIDQSLYNLVSITISNCFKLKDLPPLGQISSLKHLNLNGLLAVKQVGYSLYGSNRASTIFPSLTELEIYNMPEWIEWSGVSNKLLFPHLEMLYINDCPKLTKIPTLPSSLKRLSVSRAALGTLPGLYQLASDGGGVSSASCTLSLSSLYVVECPNVTTLVGLPLLHLFKNNHSLENLSIKFCTSLLHMPVKLLAELKFLSRLTVFDCPNLVACESTQLPRRLKCLSFGSCGDLEPLIFSSLHHLTSLVELRITNCGSIQSLPSGEVFGNLTNLSELSVDTCNELASLGGIEELTVLRSLTIQKCRKLISISLLQLPLVSENNQAGFARHYLKLDKLQELVIDHSSLLMLDPLRNLRTVRSLRIRDGSQITSLPEQWLLQNQSSLRNLTLHGVSSLQALPSSLGSMHCLQDLTIQGARLLSSLPYLPASLKYLSIRGCQSELKDMFVGENGIYWSKISHIQTVFFESIEDED